MTALRQVLALFETKFDDKELKEGEKSTNKATDALKKLATVVGSAALVVGIKSLVEDIRSAGDNLDKTSKQLGTTTAELQEMRHAANLSGVAAGQFDQALRLLGKNADMAAQGGKLQSELFERLGVKLKDTEGKMRSVSELLPDIADGFKNNVPDSEKLGVSLQILGRAGAQLLPMFEDGAEGVAKMRAEVAALGGGVSEEAVQASVELTDNMARFDLAMLSVKSRIVAFLIPAIDWMIRKFTATVAWFSKLTDGTNLITAGAVALGSALTVALAPAMAKAALAGWGMLKPLLPWIAAIGLAILILDELITTFEGGDTIIRRAVDGMFGEGATAKAVGFAKELWNSFSRLFTNMGGVVDDFALAFKLLWGEVVGWFASSLNLTDAEFRAMWSGVASWFSGKVAEISEGWTVFTTGLSAAWSVMPDGIISAFNLIQEPIFAVIDSVTGYFKSAYDRIMGGITSAVNFVSDALGGVLGEGVVLAAEVGQGGVADRLATANAAISPSSVSSQVSNNINNSRSAQSVSQTNHVTVHMPKGSSAGSAQAVGRAVSGSLRPIQNGAAAALAPGF